jgi:di/tricarboxylate transporter
MGETINWLGHHWQALMVGGILVLVFVGFAKEWCPPDVLAMSGFVLLLLLGIIDISAAGRIFGNPAPLVVGSLFIVSAALERTGVIEAMGNWFARLAGSSPTRILLALALLVVPLSAAINNTPVVVIFMPIIIALCRKHGLAASHYLIPLSFLSIVGGTCTLVGTSTNIIAAGIAQQMGVEQGIAELERPFGMFEITGLGLIFVVVTIVYLLTAGRRLLPERASLASLIDSEEEREFLTQAVIGEGSPLIGEKIPDTWLGKVRGLRVLEVRRSTLRIRLPVGDIRLQEGDQLLFKTRITGVMEVRKGRGLELLSELVGSEIGEGGLGIESVRTEKAVLMEGIVGPGSQLAGRSLRELCLRQHYGVLILAVHRRGENLREGFEDVPLAFGDSLLLEGPVEGMNRLFEQKDFINLSKPKERPLRRDKAPLAIFVLIAFIALGALTQLPLLALALAGVCVLLISRCIEPGEAYEAVDWRIVFMIFGMLGMGEAMQSSGLAVNLARGVVFLAGGLGAVAVLSAIYLLTTTLTELISNNAVAALMTPLAVGVAIELGVDPRPFVVAVMFGASNSFVTPIGYQTNTYVFGAGGYRFGDFFKVGMPLAVILWIVGSLMIPVIWPL